MQSITSSNYAAPETMGTKDISGALRKNDPDVSFQFPLASAATVNAPCGYTYVKSFRDRALGSEDMSLLVRKAEPWKTR